MISWRVRVGHELKMPLLTELKYPFCFVLQIFRAYGAAANERNATNFQSSAV
jgi:hypothetical protein